MRPALLTNIKLSVLISSLLVAFTSALADYKCKILMKVLSKANQTHTRLEDGEMARSIKSGQKLYLTYQAFENIGFKPSENPARLAPYIPVSVEAVSNDTYAHDFPLNFRLPNERLLSTYVRHLYGVSFLGEPKGIVPKNGDWVSVDRSKFSIYGKTGYDIDQKFDRKIYPTLPMQVISQSETGGYFVRFSFEGQEYNTTVPYSAVVGEILGSKDRVDGITTALSDLESPKLRKGQSVRCRTGDGVLQFGLVKEIVGDTVTVTINNSELDFPRKAVFGNSKSPIHTVSYSKFEGTDSNRSTTPTGIYLDFLNAVARYTSTPAFNSYKEREKVEYLSELVAKLLPWRHAGKIAEDFGLKDKSDLICSGAAVCRHSNVILADVLRETGFDVNIVTSPYRSQIDKGHLWLIVKISDKDFIVDVASSESNVEIFPFDELSSRMDPFSLRHYRNPEARNNYQ